MQSRAQAELTRLYRGHQQRLTDDTIRRLLILWNLVQGSLISEDEWVALSRELLAGRYAVSATLARAYYRSFRITEQVSGVFVQTPVVGFNSTRTVSGLRNALLYASRLADLGYSPAEAAGKAGLRMARWVEQESQAGGRDQIIGSSREDPQAVGWYRISDGDPCAFCALMVSRGVVYRSERSALFRSHPSCGCTAAPAFNRDRFQIPEAEQWDSLYQRASKGSSDPWNAFRRAFERPPMG